MIIPVFLLYIWQSSWLCAGCIYLPLWCFLNVHMELSGIAEVFSEVRIKQNLEKQQNFMNKHLTQMILLAFTQSSKIQCCVWSLDWVICNSLRAWWEKQAFSASYQNTSCCTITTLHNKPLHQLNFVPYITLTQLHRTSQANTSSHNMLLY